MPKVLEILWVLHEPLLFGTRENMLSVRQGIHRRIFPQECSDDFLPYGGSNPCG